MSKENLIYNYAGDKYWEPVFNVESGRLNLHEGNHGHYVGLVVRFEADTSLGNDYVDYYEYGSYEEFKVDYDRVTAGDESFSQEIINLHDGKYIGEILSGRLVVDGEKEKKRRVRPNILYKPFGRMGYLRQPKQQKKDVPKGYHDFEEGWV